MISLLKISNFHVLAIPAMIDLSEARTREIKNLFSIQSEAFREQGLSIQPLKLKVLYGRNNLIDVLIEVAKCLADIKET